MKFFVPLVACALAQNINCPTGFYLADKKCEQTLITNPNYKCHVGSLVGDYCENNATKTSTCPIGTQLQHNMCIGIQAEPIISSCPHGFTEAGNSCVQANSLETIDYCEFGSLDENGQCVNIEIANKMESRRCPNGYADHGKGCVREVEYDCSGNLGRALKKKSKYSNNIVPLAPNYVSKGAATVQSRTGKEYPLPTAPVAPSPPPASQVHVATQTCVRKDFADPIISSSCPVGFVAGRGLNVGTCTKTTTRYPTKKCIDGRPLAECENLTSIPKERSCANGKMVGNFCEVRTTLPPITACPAGTEEWGNSCKQKIPAVPFCKTGILENQLCIEKRFADPVGTVTRTCVGKECYGNH